MIIFALENMFLKMENSTKKGRFAWLVDLPVMLILFLVSQFVIGVVMGVMGTSAPVVPVKDEVPIDVYVSGQEALARWNAMFYPFMMLLPIVLMWIYARLRGGKGSMRIRCSAAGLNPTIILVGLVWLLSSQIVLEPLVLMLPKVSTPGVGLGALAYLVTIVFAPILEEIL